MAKPHKSIEDALADISPVKDVGEAIKKYDSYTKLEDHHFNNILHPAVDEMYQAFSSNLKFKEEDKIYGKKKEIRKAAVEAMKKFFAKTHPSVLEAVKEIKDADELYETLVHHYDSYTGLNESKEGGLARLVEGITRTKGLTAGKAKRLMYEAKAKHAQAAYQKLLSKARAHYFNGFEKHQVGAHVKKEIAKRDYSVSDHAAYAMLDLDSYLDLRKGIMEGKFDERTDLEKQYGVKYKSSENKK